MPFDEFTHALVLARARRNAEDSAPPPTVLQSLSDCLYRYKSLTSSFATALGAPPHAALNAIHAAGGAGGSGGGGGGRGTNVAGTNRRGYSTCAPRAGSASLTSPACASRERRRPPGNGRVPAVPAS